MKLLTAIPAETDRVQPFFLVVRVENLPGERHVALAFGTKGGIQPSGARDASMVLEGEQRFAGSAVYATHVFRRTEPDQRVPDGSRTVFF